MDWEHRGFLSRLLLSACFHLNLDSITHPPHVVVQRVELVRAMWPCISSFTAFSGSCPGPGQRVELRIIKDGWIWSFCCGAVGLVASWERWNAGSIPGLAQWVKDLTCCSCSLGHNCSSDLIPGPGTPYASGQPKKKEEKKRRWVELPRMG